jgi:hypothetical protein
MISGRSIINDRAICPEVQEHVPESENIRALRAVLNTLGDGFVEAIDDNTLMTIAQNQPGQCNGLVQGERKVPLFEAPGQTRVGRFGWKDQHGSVLSFAADAYVNEMGVTNRLRLPIQPRSATPAPISRTNQIVSGWPISTTSRNSFGDPRPAARHDLGGHAGRASRPNAVRVRWVQCLPC